ncbi:MAG: glycoside hydrolase family 6 protein [Solirubrobacterales bacterium]|nr:glycoside hydrolase family 6 protein [Solirubrobacterales bacterium]
MRRTTLRGTSVHRHRRHHATTHQRPPTGTPRSPSPGPATPTSASGIDLTGSQFYVNPNDSAATEARSLQASGDAAAAAQLQTIAAQPEATWLTDDSSPSTAATVTAAAAAAGKVPIFVVYDLPWRDCGQYSSGGAASPAAYETFIDGVVAALGQQRALIVVEPDALSEMSCLTSAEQQAYIELLNYAVTHLTSDPSASVYVDAGNPGWQSPTSEAAGLAQVLGASRAGFAVNVANFYPSAQAAAYGASISQLVGNRHFVIDTSRDGGSVAAGQWCNPAGARLGPTPRTATGNPLIDAELWIKTPGESDGTCNGGPSAGQFWLSYALSLIG